MSWVLWGAELSPFALKVEALLRFAGLPFRWMPREGGFRESLRYARRRRALVKGRLPLTWPRASPLDEFPAVPFLFGPDGENLYDSSAIGAWLDDHGPRTDPRVTPLLPQDDPALRFAVRLVDEALDEVGLYLVHHNRWVIAAHDNGAGDRLAREMRPLLGPLAGVLRRSFPPRQVRRLPYLFSVADPDAAAFANLPKSLRPPSRPGFPPTHVLLDRAYTELLDAVEPLLAQRPWLFGERFTLADASLYGQLGMNRTDPSAEEQLREAAPATRDWIERLARGDFALHRASGKLMLDEAVRPLLAWVQRVFVPLMQQNLEAWERACAAGETRFNERGFDAGRGLYDGILLGRPFRSVVKTFQASVWLGLRREWSDLDAVDRARLEALGVLLVA